jgi:alcohol dehydrogenase YqhD (iron-dependent ADH family)
MEKDFATHRLEHELSAVYGVTHGAGLAALWGSWARYVLPKHVGRFAQFAVNVMGIANDFAHPEATAQKGIEATERFFSTIGMPVSISELLGRDITDEEINTLADRCSRGGTITIGAMEVLDREAMRMVYQMAR